MSNLEYIFSENAPAAGGAYSHATVLNGVVYTSGQVGVNPATGVTPESFGDQVRQSIENLKAVLQTSGADLDSVLKTTCFITNVDQFSEFNTIYQEYFGPNFPSRSTFEVGLAGGFLFEIEAIAAVK